LFPSLPPEIPTVAMAFRAFRLAVSCDAGTYEKMSSDRTEFRPYRPPSRVVFNLLATAQFLRPFFCL